MSIVSCYNSPMQKIILFDIDHTLFDTPLFKESALTTFQSYEESLEVLETLKKEAILGIYSEGDIDLQTKKLLQTKLSPYFIKEYTHIFTKKLENLPIVFTQKEDTVIFLVDDRRVILSSVKTFNPEVHTIWIKRGIYQDEEVEGFTPDKTVTNLRDILPYIQEIT